LLFAKFKYKQNIYNNFVHSGASDFNISFAHIPGESQDEFLNRHLAAVRLFQWVQPLLLASIGNPDPLSFGDSGSYSEMSYILFHGVIHSMSTTDTDHPLSDKSYWGRRQLVGGEIPMFYKKAFETLKGYYFQNSAGMDVKRITDKKGFGFEIRMIDKIYPIEPMEDILRFIILICDHSYTLYKRSGFKAITNVRKSELFTKMTIGMMQEGWNYELDQDSLLELRKVLQLNINLEQNKKIYAYNVLLSINSELYKLYGVEDNENIMGQYSKLFAKDKDGKYYKLEPKIENLNFKNMNNIISITLGRSSSFKKYILDFLKEKGSVTFEEFKEKLSENYSHIAKEDSVDLIEYLIEKGHIVKTKTNNIYKIHYTEEL
jgi:hypothetical protein